MEEFFEGDEADVVGSPRKQQREVYEIDGVLPQVQEGELTPETAGPEIPALPPLQRGDPSKDLLPPDEKFRIIEKD